MTSYNSDIACYLALQQTATSKWLIFCQDHLQLVSVCWDKTITRITGVKMEPTLDGLYTKVPRRIQEQRLAAHTVHCLCWEELV